MKFVRASLLSVCIVLASCCSASELQAGARQSAPPRLTAASELQVEPVPIGASLPQLLSSLTDDQGVLLAPSLLGSSLALEQRPLVSTR